MKNFKANKAMVVELLQYSFSMILCPSLSLKPPILGCHITFHATCMISYMLVPSA